MSRGRYLAITGAVAVAALLLVFPPFMVIDPAAAETRHASLGHHPFWQPPTPKAAEEVLSRRQGSPSEGGEPLLRIRVNRVRLVFEMGAILVTALVGFALERGSRRARSAGWRAAQAQALGSHQDTSDPKEQEREQIDQ